MKRLVNSLKQGAADGLGAIARTRLGRVANYDPETYSVKVQLEPDGDLTGWMPLEAVMVGNGFGIYAAPNIDDPIEIRFEYDHINAPLAGMRLFNSALKPLSVPAGEVWIVHKTGAYFKLQSDSSVTFTDAQGATVRLNGDGTITSQATLWKHTGNMTILGDVTGEGNLAWTGTDGNPATISMSGTMDLDGSITSSGDVTAGGISVINHPHSGVQSGSGTSGPPVGS